MVAPSPRSGPSASTIRKRFIQPSGSATKCRTPSGDQRGWAVQSPGLPATTRGRAAAPASVDAEVGEAPSMAVRGEGLEDPGRRDALEPAGREIGDDDHIAVEHVRAAAVFVDTAPRIEALRCQPAFGTVGSVRLANDEH